MPYLEAASPCIVCLYIPVKELFCRHTHEKTEHNFILKVQETGICEAVTDA
uniref:Uncharacterized protein n=1 Tax=Anguilla anguilla TaxID=7936 RepID=A0A0E9PKS8_ANGAN